jgi:NAD(P)H-hydrate epimerase
LRLLTQNQAKELDRLAMEQYNIKGTQLMGSAGLAIAKLAMNKTADIHDPQIVILCGKGNNGGDGFAAAVELNKRGIKVVIFCISNFEEITGDAKYFLDLCIKGNLQIEFSGDLLDESCKCDLIIDALLGTGVHGSVKENIIPWIEWINNNNCAVISVDIPTGLQADNGIAEPVGVKANYTVTMGYAKLGLAMRQGLFLTGDIHIADIGFPNNAINKVSGLIWNKASDESISSFLQPLEINTHKYKQGNVLVIAGSKGMTGAAALCSYGSLRVGSGLVIAAAPKSLNNIYEKKITEGMTISCEDENVGYFSSNNCEEIIQHFDWADAIAIGPGLGPNEKTIKFVEKLINAANKPLVIDADGLRPFIGNNKLFKEITVPFVITPHYGEFCRLTAADSKTIESDFTSVVTDFMADFNGILVAKNAPSCIFYKNNGVVNSTGNPALATAGTGDVLTGMIAGLIAQGLKPLNAAQTAVYIHGKAADFFCEKKGMRGMIASDLLNTIPTVLNDYES